MIRDTRSGAEQKQTVGVRIEEQAGVVVLEGNRIEGQTLIEDLRKTGGPGVAHTVQE